MGKDIMVGGISVELFEHAEHVSLSLPHTRAHLGDGLMRVSYLGIQFSSCDHSWGSVFCLRVFSRATKRTPIIDMGPLQGTHILCFLCPSCTLT